MRFLDVVRLFSATLLLGTAALAVFRAPTHFLWKVAIGATEWGHAFALICLAAAALVRSNHWSGKVSVGFCVVAALLSLTPVLRATRLSRELHTPINYAGLFTGLSVPNVTSRRLVYKKVEGEDLQLDFYPADNRRKTPLLVVIHGGSWNSGDNKDFIGFDEYLASRGFAVADIMYRLAPRWRYPSASDDLRAAIDFLTQQSDALNIDPDQTILLGRSAGAQIALDVAYSTGTRRVRGVIAFYAPIDLRWSWDHPGNPLVIDTRKVLSDFLGGSPTDVPSMYDAASPINHVTANSPPTLLFHGERDELVSPRHSTALSRRLTEAGVLNFSVLLPWATHGFDYILRGPGGQFSTYTIERFLKQVLRPD